MYKFIFTKHGEKSFKKLDSINRDRIIRKLSSLKDSKNLFIFIKPLENMNPATHRLRIGDIRVIIKRENCNLYIIDIGNRGDIYK